MTRKLTLADLPKECLVAIVEATKIPIEEETIARAIIEHRLNRALSHVKRHDALKLEVRKTRYRRDRRQLEIEARRHAVNFTTLYESARKLAGEYGFEEKYFKGKKSGKAGAVSPTLPKTSHSKRSLPHEP